MKKGQFGREGLILGIDVGSVSISVVALNGRGELVEEAYSLHHGSIRTALAELLERFRDGPVIGMASPSGKTHFKKSIRVFDQQVSIIEGMQFLELNARSIIHVGAEKFFLIELDQDGNYMQTSHSSSCAAGTGSFLDQQALRLMLKDTSHLSDLAMQNRSFTPDIAARCSVFAKTDLIHAQQKGYGLEAICDSLCKGLADNIADTLFNKAIPMEPIYMTGGVAKNKSVVRHLQRFTGKEIKTDPHSHHIPAIGAAQLLWKQIEKGQLPVERDLSGILLETEKLEYYFEPLRAGETATEEMDILESMDFYPVISGHTDSVQVDRYRSASDKEGFYLGIDVGSTSSKAVLLSEQGKAFAGFYTYTSGQPLKAVQALFEAIGQLEERSSRTFTILACGTTGSGRKFIGSIIRADQDLDEITAHARAAYEINPQTDTIIEIGGQDAKFTQMKAGMVTFSHMNTVCAAGTGSFIEELAGRLGVGLEDYERMAMGRPAPLASDRCTVFMERDINQLLSVGYSVEEVLATVIHSVRENYLKKVASESHIGDHICFQGATAKNKALVAAFEQRLNKPIYVSRLCHLTGALGTALILKEEHHGPSQFRGLDLYKRNIPVTTETCDLCLNKCAISVASINGDKQAYGFLCGRDYETQKFVSKSSSGFELLRARKRLVKDALKAPLELERGQPVVGFPATLHLMEDLPFWRTFFYELGISLLSSEGYKDSLKAGKKIAGAEFCAPIDSMYGHVAYLAEKCDYVFMPGYLESRIKPDRTERYFCYYTQFSTSLAYLEGVRDTRKLVSPMVNFAKSHEQNVRLLLSSMKQMGLYSLTASKVSQALKSAHDHSEKLKRSFEELYEKSFKPEGDVSVVLLGRPYVVLSETLNKGIPDIFTRMGVDAWYQDMLKVDENQDPSLDRLLKKIPWHFASNIIRAAEEICRTRTLYPVFITAFKCAPDSFIIEYFKQLMHLYGKPYLVIQIDEHDSNVGYETRIEAALRSFRNHSRSQPAASKPDLGGLLPRVETKLNGKTLLMPNWDMFVSPLIVANLRRAGIDARIMETNELTIRKSMVHNTGQCLPINVMAQNFIEYVEKHQLDPAQTILWSTEANVTCNIRQYPFYIKHILEQHGQGMEKASVYSGKITHRELSIGVTYYAYFAYMLGGLFRKVSCRIRPYELVPGQTDEVFKQVHEVLLHALSGDSSMEAAIEEGMRLVDQIAYDKKTRKPLVAIFGDLYVRDNDVMNQDLIKDIERAGGEVLVTPYHEYTKIVIENIFRRAGERGEHVETSVNRILLNVIKFMDDKYYKAFSKYLGPAPVIKPRVLEKHLSKFNISRLHGGESYDNILKIFYIMENYPSVSLFVQTNPSFCCAALVTEAMTRRIREMTGVPIVTITYDGTSDRMNDVIVPYIQSTP